MKRSHASDCSTTAPDMHICISSPDCPTHSNGCASACVGRESASIPGSVDPALLSRATAQSLSPPLAHSGGRAPRGEWRLCSNCRHFNSSLGWCYMHNSQQWPDERMCRLGAE